MKLNETRPYLETSGEIEEQFFSIQDTGMIFDILRNKMYSNPILAIAREVSCNARDAHREVGKSDIPIEIHLPNSLQPEYRIKDFGPGISPDRMVNIFIKYTASTKRSDNIQTGGFGLGAKTPFSYSDAFSIITVHNGKRYLYNCVIDETKVGKLLLAHEEETDLPNGTEIVIPVLSKNFNEFITWTEQACRHWDVKPIIHGARLEWNNPNIILQGNKWALTAGDHYNRSAKMIIDGIEYPLDLDVLRKYADSKLIDSCRGNFLMYFGVGELTLSASREQVYLDEKTQVVIRNRLTEIQNEIKQQVLDKIESYPDFWEANIYYHKELVSSFNNIKFLGQLSWRGLILQDNHYVGIGCPMFSFSKGKYSRKYGTDPNKLSRSATQYISFERNSALFINDLPIREPTPRHVKKAFEDDPTLTNVQIICPTDKVKVEDLNKSIHLDQMKPRLLSSITKASARAYTPATSRLLVFKFDVNSRSFRQVSYASIEEDGNNKVLCFLAKQTYPDMRLPKLTNNKYLGPEAITTLLKKFPDISIYGIDVDAPANRVSEDFSDFIHLEKFIEKKIVKASSVNYLEIKFARSNTQHLDERAMRISSKLVSAITDPNSLYLKRLNLHLKIKQLASAATGLLEIYETFNGEIDDVTLAQFKIDHPEYDVLKLDEESEKKYPLLEHIQSYNYSEIAPHIAHYVNLIDKE